VRRRLGYPHVASTLALVVALGGGTAWAATHHWRITSTSQIKPSVLAKLHGKRGPAGTAGVAGTNGTNGTQGATGATGATGPAGPFPTSLPVGQTLTGVWGTDGTAAAGGAAAQTQVSFAFALASAPSQNIVLSGGSSTAACPGTLANPQATAGNLCLYEDVPTNANTLSIGDPANNTGNASSRFGAVVNIRSVAAGFFADNGTWAVTG